jgi:hypothetical protein
MTFGRKHKHKRDDKAKRSNNRRGILWVSVLVVWIAIAIYWCSYTIALRQDAIIAISLEDLSIIPNYSELLGRYSLGLSTQLLPLIIPFVSVGICIRISLLARKWWLALITVLCLIPVGFMFAVVAGLSIVQGGILYHLDTIENDGHVYHLTRHQVIRGDVRSFGELLLLTCDDSGDVCTGSGIISYPNYSDFNFSIDENNQLQVVSDNRILFTLDDN